jgi:hypothetical protein
MDDDLRSFAIQEGGFTYLTVDGAVTLHFPGFFTFSGVDQVDLEKLREVLVTALVGVERELDSRGFFAPPTRYTTPEGERAS